MASCNADKAREMNGLSNTAKLAIDAYGGVDRWQGSKRVRAVVSASGLAFTLKRRPAFERAVIECDVHRPYCRLTPIGQRPDVTGVLMGQDVELQDSSGAVLAKRESARKFFPFGRRTLWWDDMDMAYFACYAFWNYLTLPRLLMHSDIVWKELEAGHLRAQFPTHIPTHSQCQDYYFDTKSGLLQRYDYTAEVIAPFARPANVVLSHSKQKGIAFPAERKVTPIGFRNKPLSSPVLIHIDVHEFTLMS
jgi:hypothetical protein